MYYKGSHVHDKFEADTQAILLIPGVLHEFIPLDNSQIFVLELYIAACVVINAQAFAFIWLK